VPHPRPIYEAAGWWNEHWARVKTLAKFAIFGGAVVLIVGGSIVHRFGLLGTICIAVGVVVIVVGLVGWAEGKRHETKAPTVAAARRRAVIEQLQRPGPEPSPTASGSLTIRSNVVGPSLESDFPDVVMDFTGQGVRHSIADKPGACVFPRVRIVNRSSSPVSLSFAVWQRLEQRTAIPEAGNSVLDALKLLPVKPSSLPDPLDLNPSPGSASFSEVAYYWPYTTSDPSLSMGGTVGPNTEVEAYDYISEKRIRFGGRWPESLAKDPW
jgi:hypothetical protein